MIQYEKVINMPSDQAPMKEWAIFYAKLGIPVFAIHPRTKDSFYPDYEHLGAKSKNFPKGTPYSWKAQATTDIERINKTWDLHPEANIGGCTGQGLYVVDVDVRDGIDGHNSFAQIEEMPDFPEDEKFDLNTWKDNTGGGGNQYFYYLNPDQVKKTAHRNINLSGDSAMVFENSKLDTRGDGRFCILPPSIHPNGNRYAWSKEQNPESMNMLQMNRAIEYLFTHKSTKEKGKNGAKHTKINKAAGELVPHGSRYEYMVEKAGQLTRRMANDFSDDTIVAALMNIAHSDLDESECPIDFDELQRKMEYTVSVYRAKQEEEKQSEKDIDWSYCTGAYFKEHPDLKELPDHPDWEEIRKAGERRKQSEIESTSTEIQKQVNWEFKERFHFWDKDHKNPISVNDYEIFCFLKQTHNLFLLKGKLYIYRGGRYLADETGTITKTLIRNLLYDKFIKSTNIERVYKLFLTDSQMEISIDKVNDFPSTWVNFKNGMLDVLTGEMHEHDPKYYSINQIPHNYIPNLDFEKSVFNQFLNTRIEDPEDRQMLYEYMGSCLLSSIQFQKFMMLTGKGNTGKSVILNQVKRIVGIENISAIPLQSLNEKFTTISLLHKTVNVCGDLSNAPIRDSSDIKKLTGEDLIKGEYKGGAIVFFYNYAKFFFSCNELPTVLDERSNGFYRRLLIIRFTTSGEFIPNLYDKLSEESEIETEISFLIFALKNALNRGKIYESGANLREVFQLRKDSDSVEAFMDSCCMFSPESRILRRKLYYEFEKYCKSEDRTPLGKTAFFKALRNKGYFDKKYNGTFYFFGIDTESGFEKAENIPFID